MGRVPAPSYCSSSAAAPAVAGLGARRQTPYKACARSALRGKSGSKCYDVVGSSARYTRYANSKLTYTYKAKSQNTNGT